MDKLTGDWEKTTILESDTGKSYSKYFYKKEPAYRVIVDTPKARILSGYHLIEKDLRSALIWLNAIKEHLIEDESFTNPKGHVDASYNRETFDIVNGLFVSALTFYGKSFAKCKGRRVKLEKGCLDTELHEIHEFVMKYRHNFAAHSGEEELECACVVIASAKNKEAPPCLVNELIQPDTVCLKDLDMLVKLFESAREYTQNKIDTVANKVYKDDVIS